MNNARHIYCLISSMSLFEALPLSTQCSCFISKTLLKIQKLSFSLDLIYSVLLTDKSKISKLTIEVNPITLSSFF